MSEYSYPISDEWYSKIKKEIFDDYLGDPNQKYPTMTVVLGQNASGKTTAIRKAISKAHPKKVTNIDKDDFLLYHAQIQEIYIRHDKEFPKYVAAWNNKCEKDLLNEAMERKTEILLQSTGRKTELALEQLRLAKENGYINKVVLVATNINLSKLGIFQRYNANKMCGKIARFVNLDVHNEAYDAIPKTIKKIYEEKIADIQIVKRDDTLLYDSKMDEFKDINPTEVIKNERDKGLTKDEKVFFREEIEKQIEISESLGNKEDVEILTKLRDDVCRTSINKLLDSIDSDANRTYFDEGNIKTKQNGKRSINELLDNIKVEQYNKENKVNKKNERTR